MVFKNAVMQRVIYIMLAVGCAGCFFGCHAVKNAATNAEQTARQQYKVTIRFLDILDARDKVLCKINQCSAPLLVQYDTPGILLNNEVEVQVKIDVISKKRINILQHELYAIAGVKFVQVFLN